jgi:hypothetical protein
VISTPETDLSTGLAVLESAIVDTAPLRPRCGTRRDIGASSFTGVGRAGLPRSPDAPLTSGYVSGQTVPRLAFASSNDPSRAGHAAGPAVAASGPCYGAP